MYDKSYLSHTFLNLSVKLKHFQRWILPYTTAGIWLLSLFLLYFTHPWLPGACKRLQQTASSGPALACDTPHTSPASRSWLTIFPPSCDLSLEWESSIWFILWVSPASVSEVEAALDIYYGNILRASLLLSVIKHLLLVNNFCIALYLNYQVSLSQLDPDSYPASFLLITTTLHFLGYGQQNFKDFRAVTSIWCFFHPREHK